MSDASDSHQPLDEAPCEAVATAVDPDSDAVGPTPAADSLEDRPLSRGANQGAAARDPNSASPLDGSARRPTFVFFGALAGISLLADVASKAWAQVVLSQRTTADPAIVLIDHHLTLVLAYNRGGAWGILQDASEAVRRPFFLLVSIAAIVFIVSLYNRLHPAQRALTWGLPLVLGGALGNLTDRIVRNSVIDFIDYRADWVRQMNELIAAYLSRGWTVTDHWPTYNIADVSICIGVGLMAIDMLFSRRGPASVTEDPRSHPRTPSVAPPGGSGEDDHAVLLDGLSAVASNQPPAVR
ncbi:MAG: signal peptidase II [Polyangiaceae bacterium]|nr:signal peptidase II [Polyangiaceae bacterium]